MPVTEIPLFVTGTVRTCDCCEAKTFIRFGIRPDGVFGLFDTECSCGNRVDKQEINWDNDYRAVSIMGSLPQRLWGKISLQ